MEETTSKSLVEETPCKGCGASLKFAPGTNHLKCDYCGTQNEIMIAPEKEVAELDYHSYLNKAASQGELLHEVHTVDCSGCGASTTLQPNIVSDECPFCGKAMVVGNGSRKAVIKPESVLPFKIDQKSAFTSFSNWIKKLWFAPNDLKRFANSVEKLKGMYIPYWTYDCNTASSYVGEKGINRQETQYYTENINGKNVTSTRTVTVTDWYPVSGYVDWSFNDVLVNASNSLPKTYADNLEPWDLPNLVPYNENYLSGFRSETYQVGLEQGFEIAKEKMAPAIESRIRYDIGGDQQRIHSFNTDYSNIKFKHTLLPIWISAYRYNGKVYRFMINGRTGEVQGERPYSWIKITLAVLGGIALIAVLANVL